MLSYHDLHVHSTYITMWFNTIKFCYNFLANIYEFKIYFKYFNKYLFLIAKYPFLFFFQQQGLFHKMLKLIISYRGNSKSFNFQLQTLNTHLTA